MFEISNLDVEIRVAAVVRVVKCVDLFHVCIRHPDVNIRDKTFLQVVCVFVWLIVVCVYRVCIK